MIKRKEIIKDIFITLIILCLSFMISLLFQNVFEVHEHISTVFVFAVFLISLTTNGYIYGILAAVISAVAVNYAFTFPFFAFSYAASVNIISAVVMIIISILTSALLTKLKYHEKIKADSEKERMRANLLRAVSHDLRTPLTTIYGSTTALLENGSTMTNEQKIKILKSITEDSQWLMRMVENLLSITKIDDGKVKIIKTPTVLEELIDSVILKFKKRYPIQEIAINIPEEILIIPMDALLIEQVIINILENAVQHAKGMTELSICVILSKNKAIFEIKDNGSGIDPQRLDSIFTVFFDSKDDSFDNQKKNAGIGLSVCSTIIKAHGGLIEAQNLKTGGALFRFILDTEGESCDTE